MRVKIFDFFFFVFFFNEHRSILVFMIKFYDLIVSEVNILRFDEL